MGLNGYAKLFGKAFAYRSRWSDPETWPGHTLPMEGDDVIIAENDIVLLDISPPALGLVEILGQLLLTDNAVRKMLALEIGNVQHVMEQLLSEATLLLPDNWLHLTVEDT